MTYKEEGSASQTIETRIELQTGELSENIFKKKGELNR